MTLLDPSMKESSSDYRKVAVLNPEWRVIECSDGIQWIVQRYVGNRWRGVSYHRDRASLLQRIPKLCSPYDTKALIELQSFPEWVFEKDAEQQGSDGLKKPHKPWSEARSEVPEGNDTSEDFIGSDHIPKMPANDNVPEPIRIVHISTKGTTNAVKSKPLLYAYALVPLARGRSGWAVVDEQDLALLESLGLSLRWTRDSGTGAVHAPASAASGRQVSVGRVLMDAGDGQSVKFLNGDPTDLRRENLQLAEGSGTRRDRDFLASKPRKWGAEIIHQDREVSN